MEILRKEQSSTGLGAIMIGTQKCCCHYRGKPSQPESKASTIENRDRRSRGTLVLSEHRDLILSNVKLLNNLFFCLKLLEIPLPLEKKSQDHYVVMLS